jgi:protein-disulfide isomerase
MKKTLFIAAGMLLLLVFVAGAIYFNAEKTDQAGQLIEQNQAGLVRDYSPQLGPTAAKVRIVEFLDPACGTCKRFYPFVKDILTTHPEQTHLTLRYAPFHENSDQVVAMLYAADKQGKHWEVLEALLASQDDWVANHVVQPERAWQHLQGLGLDLAQLQADMASPAIAQQISQDMADVQTLNISKTPEFLVNGKPLPSFGFDPLKALIDAELANEYR